MRFWSTCRWYALIYYISVLGIVHLSICRISIIYLGSQSSLLHRVAVRWSLVLRLKITRAAFFWRRKIRLPNVGDKQGQLRKCVIYIVFLSIDVPTAGLIFCNYNLTSKLYKINYGNILKLKCQLSGFIRDFKFIFSKLWVPVLGLPLFKSILYTCPNTQSEQN